MVKDHGDPGFSTADWTATAAGGMGDGFGMGASKTTDIITAAAGGIGDGFGIGASNEPTLAAFSAGTLWGNTLNAASGGMGDGFGIGASRHSDIVAAAAGGIGEGFGIGASKPSDIVAATAGGIGEGFGMGASNADRPDFDRDCEFTDNLFSVSGVLTWKFSEEYDATAPCEFIEKRANASVITEKFRLISY